MKILYLDTETGGILSYINEILTVAGILEIDNKEILRFHIKMQPIDYSKVEKAALEVNRLTIDQIKTFKDSREALSEFLDILSPYYDPRDKIHLAGHNIAFDNDFLKNWFKRHKSNRFNQIFDYHMIDTMSVAGWLKINGYIDIPNLKLKTLCEYLGISTAFHDAANDIQATRQCFKLLGEKFLIAAPLQHK